MQASCSLCGFEGAVENRQVLGFQAGVHYRLVVRIRRRAPLESHRYGRTRDPHGLNGVVFLDVRQDPADLVVVVTQRTQLPLFS